MLTSCRQSIELLTTTHKMVFAIVAFRMGIPEYQRWNID